MLKKNLWFIIFLLFQLHGFSQTKVLFDATKAESAGNADWVIDADNFNVGYFSGPPVFGTGSESNPQRYPTLSASNITTNTPEAYWKGGLSAWAVELVQKGYQVESLPIGAEITYNDPFNPQDLANYDIYVVCEPNILFSTAEKIAILTFVQNGGGLFMISDHDMSDRNGDGEDSVEIWNDLMFNNSIQNNPFGIEFKTNFFTEASQNIASLPSNTILHGDAGDVTSLEFYGGTDMMIYPNTNPNVQGLIYRFNSNNLGTNYVLVAQSTYGNGKVVAVGDSSPFDDGTGDTNDFLYDGWIEDANGNHRKMILNATDWLATPLISSTPTPSNKITDVIISNNLNDDSYKVLIKADKPSTYTLKIYNYLGQIVQNSEKIKSGTAYTFRKSSFKGINRYVLSQKGTIMASGNIIF